MEMGTVHRQLRARKPLMVAVALTLAVAIGLLLLSRYRGESENPALANARATVSDTIAGMKLTPGGQDFPLAKAMAARKAILQGDYATAQKLSSDVAASSHQNWLFQPFGQFVSSVPDTNDSAFIDRLNKWVDQSKDSPIPLIIRAQYYYNLGWATRGSDFADKVSATKMNAFEQDMLLGVKDAEAAISLGGDNPYPYYIRLRLLHGFGVSERLNAAFVEAINRYPSYYPLYVIMLSTLDPRWGGTPEEMYAFVKYYASRASETPLVKMLSIDLYRQYLSLAITSCKKETQPPQCVRALMEKAITPELRNQIIAALQLYDHIDRYQFNAVLEEILFLTSSDPSGDYYYGTLLELAAASMHSDTQLVEQGEGPNDYLIDKAVAESWYRKGFYQNALTKDQEALKNVTQAKFPSDIEKAVAVAGIYKHLGSVQEQLHQYPEMIASEEASASLGGGSDEQHYICYGYYHIKEYDKAVNACSMEISRDSRNLTARYLRGLIYRDMGQPDAALTDFTVVAESENGFRGDAAIEMSMIFFGRKDNEGALNVLNKYSYLYDPSQSREETVAVAYNNRCYAYMELKQPEKALEDCQESLKHGSLPDAYRKERELMQILKAPRQNL